MSLVPGRRVWVLCEVKPGTFSNERMVRIVGPSGTWLGFVPDVLLRDPITHGETAVQGIVDEIFDGTVSLFLPGASIAGGVFHQDASQVTPFGSIQA